VNRGDPPEEAAYQSKVPLIGDDAPSVTVPVPHRLASMVVIDVPTTVAVAITRDEIHVAFEYSTK
jgi:hypothetical protein